MAASRAAARAGRGRGCAGRRLRRQERAETAFDAASDRFNAVPESDAYLKVGSFARAENVALRGLHAARKAGLAILWVGDFDT